MNNRLSPSSSLPEKNEAECVSENAEFEALKRSNAELEAFALVAAHELVSPLRMTANYLTLLIRRHVDALPEEGKEYARRALEGVTRMDALVKTLLDFSTRGESEPPFVSVDLNVVAAKAVETLRANIIERNAAVFIDALPFVTGAADELCELFVTLFANAIKFSEDAPVVRVCAEENGGMVTVRVSDNGIGVDESEREHIFALFKRLNARSRYAGAGIGLAIAKKIVTRHGGRIWIEANNAEGRGSAFLFTLPNAPPKRS